MVSKVPERDSSTRYDVAFGTAVQDSTGLDDTEDPSGDRPVGAAGGDRDRRKGTGEQRGREAEHERDEQTVAHGTPRTDW